MLIQRLRADEDGMTIIEILVAMIVLVVGALALLTMLSDSFTTTSQTTAREQGTNVARDVVERARQIAYSSTTTSATTAVAVAATLPETPAVSGSTFTMTRRGTTYSVAITACSIDDPADGEGLGDATFCSAPTSTTVPGSPPVGTGLAVGPNVLGLPVTLAVGGSLITTVCQAVGTDTAVANAVSSFGASLLSLAGNGAQLSVCPAASGGSIAYDAKPDDLRRIKVAVSWTRNGRTSSLAQTTLLTTPA